MPSTRASSGSLPYAASKPSSSAVSKGKSSKKAAQTGLDASISLFRSEVLSLLSAPPPVPSHIRLKPSDRVEVLGAWERVSSHGMQQSVQVCQVLPSGSRAGGEGETWVTRMEGERWIFPRAARVTKRPRGVDDADSADEAGAGMLEGEETPAARPKKSASSPAKKRCSAPDAPRKSRRTNGASSRRSRYDGDASDMDYDDGATTETEVSHLAKKHGGVRGAAPLASGSSSSSSRRTHSSRSAQRESSSVGLRRSRRHRSQEEQDDEPLAPVKQEDGLDDLASLCGRVEDLGVRSTVEPESDAFSSYAPSSFGASASTEAFEHSGAAKDVKGKGRARSTDA
ncbi:hypothetical protein JCM10213_005195 [Rhodosporidiobolus nylandii]